MVRSERTVAVAACEPLLSEWKCESSSRCEPGTVEANKISLCPPCERRAPLRRHPEQAPLPPLAYFRRRPVQASAAACPGPVLAAPPPPSRTLAGAAPCAGVVVGRGAVDGRHEAPDMAGPPPRPEPRLAAASAHSPARSVGFMDGLEKMK
ncbi:unnamed protein product [Urochloa humidicola]